MSSCYCHPLLCLASCHSWILDKIYHHLHLWYYLILIHLWHSCYSSFLAYCSPLIFLYSPQFSLFFYFHLFLSFYFLIFYFSPLEMSTTRSVMLLVVDTLSLVLLSCKSTSLGATLGIPPSYSLDAAISYVVKHP